MKITHIIAAATLFAGFGVSATAAEAQGHRYDDRRGPRFEQRYDRHDRYDRRYDRRGYRDRARRHGRGYYGRRCHTEYRHRRPVTVCYR